MLWVFRLGHDKPNAALTSSPGVAMVFFLQKVKNGCRLNQDAYVLNNPTTLTDPLGLEGSNPADPCSDPSYSNARCPGPPPCSFVGDPNCCPGPSIGGFSEEFCYPLSGDFPPPNQWNPLPAITQPTAAGQLGALGFSPESASQGVIDLTRLGPIVWAISRACRGNNLCIEIITGGAEGLGTAVGIAGVIGSTIFVQSDAGPAVSAANAKPKVVPKTNEETEQGARQQDPCWEPFQECLTNPWQPARNRPQFGPRKDCGACYRECGHANGVWPTYKCPR